MNFFKYSFIFCCSAILFVGCNKTVDKPADLVLIPVKTGNNWGYIDSTCSFKLDPVFENAGEFHNNRAFVIKAGHAAYINDSGRVICPFQFLQATDFSDSLAFVLDKNNSIQCIDVNMKTKFTLKDVQEVSIFKEGLASVKQADKYGFINKTGKVVIPCQYDDVLFFSEGLCAVSITKQMNDSTYSEWTYIDATGKTAIDSVFEVAQNFNGGLAAVKRNGKWSWIDKKQKDVFGNDFEECQSFKNGFAAYKKDGFFGLINKSGKLILEPSYAIIGNFNEGLAMVSLGPETVGFIDTTGVIKIQPEFQSASSFHNGFCYIFKGNKIGLLTKSGRLFCSGQFDSAPGFLGADFGFVDISMNTQITIDKSSDLLE